MPRSKAPALTFPFPNGRFGCELRIPPPCLAPPAREPHETPAHRPIDQEQNSRKTASGFAPQPSFSPKPTVLRSQRKERFAHDVVAHAPALVAVRDLRFRAGCPIQLRRGRGFCEVQDL